MRLFFFLTLLVNSLLFPSPSLQHIGSILHFLIFTSSLSSSTSLIPHFPSVLLLFPPFPHSHRPASTHVSLYLSSNFPCCTPIRRHHNLLLAPTFPYLSHSLTCSCLFYASILSLICSLSPSPTLPLAAVGAY